MKFRKSAKVGRSPLCASMTIICKIATAAEVISKNAVKETTARTAKVVLFEASIDFPRSFANSEFLSAAMSPELLDLLCVVALSVCEAQPGHCFKTSWLYMRPQVSQGYTESDNLKISPKTNVVLLKKTLNHVSA